ncbi:MAG: peptidoglycan D,D-transpeptidase FtsI family protein [Elainellaceae cyanobacterium]
MDDRIHRHAGTRRGRSPLSSSRQSNVSRKARRLPSEPNYRRTHRAPVRRVNPRLTRNRLVLVWGVLILSTVALAIRLFILQVIHAPELQERAAAQHMVSVTPFVPRYPILDRNGTVLAVDQLVYTLYAHPNLFKSLPSEIAERLAPVLNRPPTDLLRAFRAQDSGIRLEYALTEDVADRVADLEIDGLELVQEQQRLYPQDDLFAHVVGYVNLDRHGQAGVEYSQDTMLARSTESVDLMRMGDGSMMPDNVPEWVLHQDNQRLKLTVDSRLQRATRILLQQQIESFSAKQGVVVVMDVQDGSILSMVTEPAYNPNEYFRYELDQLSNWGISGLYEPGSTFKPLNVAIALETGAVHPNDVFYDEGRIDVGGWPIENSDYEDWGARGNVTVADILKYSSNVGMVRIMQQLDSDVFYDWLKQLGVGETTGVDLPSEAAGQFKSREQFTGAAVESATAAFGQGFSLTPIQLIQLHATLANNGMMPIPHVVDGLYTPDGTRQWQPNRPQPKRIFSAQTAQTVLGMMEQIVEDGTGEVAQISGYRIAGKTGTAQKVGEQGVYDDAAVITSFVSILPMEDPRYVVLVALDEPKGGDVYGSTVAAPVARAVMNVLIATEEISPSQPAETNQVRRENELDLEHGLENSNAVEDSLDIPAGIQPESIDEADPAPVPLEEESPFPGNE